MAMRRRSSQTVSRTMGREPTAGHSLGDVCDENPKSGRYRGEDPGAGCELGAFGASKRGPASLVAGTPDSPRITLWRRDAGLLCALPALKLAPERLDSPCGTSASEKVVIARQDAGVQDHRESHGRPISPV